MCRGEVRRKKRFYGKKLRFYFVRTILYGTFALAKRNYPLYKFRKLFLRGVAQSG